MARTKDIKRRKRIFAERSLSTSEGDGDDFHHHSRDMHENIRHENEHIELVGFVALDFGTSTTAVAYAKAEKTGLPVDPVDVHCITGWPLAAQSDCDTYKRTTAPYLPSEFIYPSTLDRMHRPDELTVRLDTDESTSNNPESHPDYATDKDERFLYGWESRADTHKFYRDSPPNAISFLKLRLLGAPSRETMQLTAGLEAAVRRLKENGILPNVKDENEEQFANEQMLNDFFLPIFEQIKEHLTIDERSWYSEQIPFYITMTWPPMCSDESREVLERACRNVEAVVRISDQPVFEFAAQPEAAKDFVLDTMRKNISVGESFVVLDCGGGTVDAHTYTNRSSVHKSSGIRRAGKCCGARFVTEAARRMLVKELKKRDWASISRSLEAVDSSIEEVIASAVDHFEANLQTYFAGKDPWHPKIFGIRRENQIVFTANDVSACFQHSLEGTVEVMRDQLEQARQIGLTMRKVILAGGFSRSPALRKRLQKELDWRERAFGGRIDLVFLDSHDRNAENPVACGAVLRASKLHVRRRMEAMNNVDNGQDPRERIARYSYGVLRREVYQPGRYIGHRRFPRRNLKEFRNPITWEIELQTIQWLKQKGDIMTPGVFAEIECVHEFDSSRPALICREKFYSSDKNMQSHFDEDSPENKAHARFVSHFEVDMTFLKDKGLPLRFEGRARPVYVVQFTLRILYNGDKLDFQIEYKINDESEIMSNLPKTSFKFGLAAHFYEREIHLEPLGDDSEADDHESTPRTQEISPVSVEGRGGQARDQADPTLPRGTWMRRGRPGPIGGFASRRRKRARLDGD